jgi:hypothetical protein
VVLDGDRRVHIVTAGAEPGSGGGTHGAR